MSGALAERVFVKKLQKVGFVDVQVVERTPFGLEQASEYPLFTDDVLKLMQDLIPSDRQDRIAMSITVTANNPS